MKKFNLKINPRTDVSTSAYKKERQILQAVESMGQGMILTDAYESVTWMNAAALELLGQTEQSVLGKKLSLAFPLVDTLTNEPEQSPAALALELGHAVGFYHHTALKSANGSGSGSRWGKMVSVNCSPIFGSEGECTGTVTIFRDITSMKQFEQHLRDDRSNLNTLFENNPAGMMIVDDNALIQRVNEPMRKLINIGILEVEHLPLGEALSCRNSTDAGCGCSKPCLSCDIRNSVSSVAASGASINEVITQLSVSQVGASANSWLKLWFAPMLIEGRTHVVVGVEDITNIKWAERRKAQAFDYYREQFENFPAMVWRAGLDRRCNYLNRSALDFLGLELPEALSLGWVKKLHPEDNEPYYHLVKAAFLDRAPFETEFRLQRYDGVYCWMKSFGKPDYNVDGEFLGYSGAIFDIEEQKRLEQSLKTSRDHYLSMFENLPQMVWSAGSIESYDFCNKALLEFTGRTLEEELETPMEQRIHPGDLSRYRLEWSRNFERKSPYRTEYRMKRYDGEYRFIGDGRSPVYDLSGSFTGYIGLCMDITEKKLAEEVRLRYDVLLQKATDIILFLTLDGDIIEANDAAVTSYGYTREELCSMNISMLREDAMATIALLQTAASSGLFFETTHLRKDGTLIPVEVNSKSVQLGERHILISIIRDITERKRYERELIVSMERAEAASLAKSEFLANMSHEIRTPINGINGMIQLALMEELPTQVRNDLKTAVKCVDMLLTVINDILDFSKMEAGKLEIIEESFKLSELLRDTMRIHAAQATDKGLVFNYVISSNTPQLLRGDPNRITQILNNLVGNAVKFTECGGINVTVSRTGELGEYNEKMDENGSESGNRYEHEHGRVELLFSISDTGIGISSDNMEKLFQSFSQEDSSITRRFGGTGLGLSISKQLVELMDGRIWVESEKGVGSTFHFTLLLPFTPQDNGFKKKESDGNLLPRAAQLKVLVVDDDPINQFVLKQLVKQKGCIADTAHSGIEALEILSRSEYDIIFMDMQMPGMDGIETTRRIRIAEDSRRHTPIVAVTAHTLKGDRERYLREGMEDYLPKPIQVDDLFELIDQYERRRQSR